MNLKWAIVVLSLCATTHYHTQQAMATELSCYHFSGPAFALMRHARQGLSLSEIDEQVSDNLKSQGPISAILTCAKEQDIPLFHYSVGFESMASTPNPYLAVIERVESGGKSLEFVLVQSHQNDMFLVYQFRGLGGWTVFDKHTFKRVYGGSLLTLRKQVNLGMTLVQKLGIFVVGFLIMLFSIAFVKRLRNYTAVLVGMITIGIFSVSGCSEEPGVAAARSTEVVSSLTPNLQLGARSQLATIPVVFRFKTGDAEFMIEEVVTDCGCLEAPQNVKGQKYPADSEFELNFTLRTGKQVGAQAHWARLSGFGDGKKGVVDSDINYFVKPRPEVHPEKIVLRRIKGDNFYRASALVVMSQQRHAPKATLKLNDPGYSPFRISVTKTEHSFSAGAASTRDDRFRISVEVDSASIENPERPREIKVYVVDHDDPAIVRIEFETVQPIGCDNKNIFLGFVDKNTELNSVIRLNNRTDSILDATLRSNSKLIGDRAIKLTPGSNRIPLRWSSGSKPGRIDSSISFFPKSMPSSEIRIKLSWIVKEGETP